MMLLAQIFPLMPSALIDNLFKLHMYDLHMTIKAPWSCICASVSMLSFFMDCHIFFGHNFQTDLARLIYIGPCCVHVSRGKP